MPSVDDILSALRLGGAALPASRRLFELILPLFGAGDQETLKAAYAQARAESDDADDDLKDAIAGR